MVIEGLPQIRGAAGAALAPRGKFAIPPNFAGGREHKLIFSRWRAAFFFLGDFPPPMLRILLVDDDADVRVLIEACDYWRRLRGGPGAFTR